MKYDTATPYIASYVIFRDGSKVAFVLREHTAWMNDFYGLPSGKVEPHESFTAAAIREAKEEVGVDLKADDLKYVLTMHRGDTHPSNDELTWVDVYFEATNWQGELINAEPHMHKSLDWLDLNDLPENVIPAVKLALEAIAAGQTYTECYWQ